MFYSAPHFQKYLARHSGSTVWGLQQDWVLLVVSRAGGRVPGVPRCSADGGRQGAGGMQRGSPG